MSFAVFGNFLMFAITKKIIYNDDMRKTKVYQIRLTPDEHKALKLGAWCAGVPLSRYIRGFIFRPGRILKVNKAKSIS